MSRNEKDSSPPPYSEFYTSRGQTILDKLTLTRTHHIQAVIDMHIIPLVEQQAAYGIAQTIIAMLPSDIPLRAVEEKSEFSFDSASGAKPVEVIGFSSEEAPKVVRLDGQMNRIEFWRPQAVIVELERALKESLNASPQLRSPSSPNRSGIHDFDHVSRQDTRGLRRSFLSRMVPSLGPEQPSPSGNPEIGIKQVQTIGSVLVKVRLEEITLRTTNDFGLYDTTSKQCIIVRVDARC